MKVYDSASKVIFIIMCALQINTQLISMSGITLNKDVLVTKNCSLLSLIKNHIPTIVFDLKYATTDNFTHQQVYETPSCYARIEVINALQKVQVELAKHGLGLKIWDAYRPWQAQCKFWELVPDEMYVSDPRKGGRHTKGTAIDVTLVDLATGEELEMPTEFDDFTVKAHSTYADLTPQVLANRSLLKNIMEKHGFKVARTEWWHYDYKGWQNLPVIDLTLSDLDTYYKKS